MGTRKKNEDIRYRKVRRIKKTFWFLSLVFRSFVLDAFVVLSSIPSLVSLYSLSLPLSLSLNYFFAFLPVFVFISFPHMADQTRFKKVCGFPWKMLSPSRSSYNLLTAYVYTKTMFYFCWNEFPLFKKREQQTAYLVAFSARLVCPESK